MVPLIAVPAQDMFKTAKNRSGQVTTVLPVSEICAVIRNRGKNMGGISGTCPRQIHGQKGATGGACKFRSRRGCREWPIKQADFDSGVGWWTIQQKGDDCTGIETSDHFDKGEGVAADDEGFHLPTSACRSAHFGEAGPGFVQSEDRERDTFSAEERSAEFPITEMQGDEKDATTLSSSGFEIIPASAFTKEIVTGITGFHAPYVSKFGSEVFEQPLACDVSPLWVVVAEGEEIVGDDTSAVRSEAPRKGAAGATQNAKDGRGEPSGEKSGGVPEVGPVGCCGGSLCGQCGRGLRCRWCRS